MLTLDGLCSLTAGLGTTTAPLRQACALSRSQADARPLPMPRTEFPFDSSWEAIFTGIDVANELEVLDGSLKQ